MFCVSVLISSDEWLRFQQTAQVIWQGETLSRSEIMRRHASTGLKPLQQAAPVDQAQMTREFKNSMFVRTPGCGAEKQFFRTCFSAPSLLVQLCLPTYIIRCRAAHKCIYRKHRRRPSKPIVSKPKRKSLFLFLICANFRSHSVGAGSTSFSGEVRLPAYG